MERSQRQMHDTAYDRVQGSGLLDSYYFLDLSPVNKDVCDMCLAKHEIFLAKFDKDSLSLTPIDSDWLKKSISQKTVSLATVADDTDTITA